MRRKQIVILGGGFGGIYTAMHLEKLQKKYKNFDIHLVNKENYFVYQPMLAEVVGGSLGILDTVSSIRRLLPNSELYIRDVEAIDIDKKVVSLSPQFSHSSYKLYYDHLVLALGNVTDFRGTPGLHEHALPFKNLADSIAIRNQVIDAIETASNIHDPIFRKQLLTFVVGGGGFSGVEAVAEINDLAKKMAKKLPRISPDEIRVVLVHSKNLLMERELSESLGKYAAELLQKRGVEILFGRRLASATPEEAILADGSRISSKTIISSVPSSPNPLIETLDLPKEKGKIKTEGSLRVQGRDDIWAIGDCALIPLVKEDNKPCPPTAQFAIREAKVLAKNIIAKNDGKPEEDFYFKALGMLGALGHHSAVAELFGKFKFSGILAWALWRMIYWMKLPGIDRKIKVMFSWMLDMLIPIETVQLKIAPSQGIAQLHFESGEIIFHEGDVGDYLYIIADGQVEVLKEDDNKKLQPICTLGKGEYFGEMALLNEKMRSATVRAKSSCNILALKNRDFGMLIANFSELRENFENTEKCRRKELEENKY